MHMISGLYPGLWYLLPTLHERRHRHPCKARFRLAGCAFAGRVSNPLERDERFQVIALLLSRTSPVASWIHTDRESGAIWELVSHVGVPAAPIVVRPSMILSLATRSSFRIGLAEMKTWFRRSQHLCLSAKRPHG
jgi:hypothetical protein